MLRRINLFNFYAPESDKGGGVASERGIEDIIEALGKDDNTDDEVIDLNDKKESKSKADDKTKDDKDLKSKEDDNDLEVEDDELADIEAELDDDNPDDEKLELSVPVPKREILKKYPNLFKEYPYLEKSYYREREFTEIFPTIPEAREAAEKAETLGKYEKDLADGNIEVTLRTVKENPKAFNKLADNYLQVLANVDEKAYHVVVEKVIKHVQMAMVREGKRSGNEALEAAATVINQYMFGSSEFTAPTKLSSDEPEKENEEAAQLKKDKAQFIEQQFTTAKDGLDTRINNSIKSTIDQHIDPKDSMGSYVKKAAIAEALANATELIAKDSRFKVIVDKLWENAFKSNFSKDSIDRIRSAYLSKAKTVLPSVIQKARNEAMRGIGKRVREDNDSVDDKIESRSSNKTHERRSAPDNNERKRSVDKPRPGESALDYLMRD